MNNYHGTSKKLSQVGEFISPSETFTRTKQPASGHPRMQIEGNPNTRVTLGGLVNTMNEKIKKYEGLGNALARVTCYTRFMTKKNIQIFLIIRE